jgi:hypothetical protein
MKSVWLVLLRSMVFSRWMSEELPLEYVLINNSHLFIRRQSCHEPHYISTLCCGVEAASDGAMNRAMSLSPSDSECHSTQSSVQVSDCRSPAEHMVNTAVWFLRLKEISDFSLRSQAHCRSARRYQTCYLHNHTSSRGH